LCNFCTSSRVFKSAPESSGFKIPEKHLSNFTHFFLKTGSKRLSYQCHNPVEYNKLVARAKAVGFGFEKSEIKDDYIVKVYKKGNLIIRFKSVKETQDYRDVTLYMVLILPYSEWLFLPD
jgi:hypothetical protein